MPQSSMRAAVLTGPRSVECHTVPRPRPERGQVLVEIEGCGLCGSNLPVWEGRPWFDYPLPPGNPGHEGWGRVVERGPGVSAVEEGQRVAFLSDRAFAEYDAVAEDLLVPLPGTLDEADVPGEPLGCAMNIWRRSDIQAGHTVAVVGVGFFGALLTQLAARAGARVIALSRRPFSLELAERMGAAETLQLGADDGAVTKRVFELTDGRGCERVVEATGHQRAVDLAGALCATRGRLIIAGFHQDGPRQIDLQLWNWRGLDVINAHERDPQVYREGMRAAIDALASGQLEAAPLLSHRVPLAGANSAFQLLHDRPEGFVKALVVP